MCLTVVVRLLGGGDAAVPAKIASFDDKFDVKYREDVKLPCQAVGAPLPEIRWSVKGVPYEATERVRLLPEGSLLIREVTRDDAGEYSCTVENMYGQDTVTHQLQVQGLKHLPTVFVPVEESVLGTFHLDESKCPSSFTSSLGVVSTFTRSIRKIQ